MTMKLKDLREQLSKLPKNIEDNLSANRYLDTLRQDFVETVRVFSMDPTGKIEFNNFVDLQDKTDAGIEEFVNDVDKMLSNFNDLCLKCLKPDAKPEDFKDFINLFFDNDTLCRDEKVMTETIDYGTDFYRIRSTGKQNQYELFSRKEMYMMGTKLSSKVGTARFNLSGYACLYLAESLYLAWEECRRPDFHTANFVRFINRKNLKVFTLTLPDAKKLNSLPAFFRTYLSLACSVKAKDDDKDHWQYRISNLFIKMIYQLEGHPIDGIKYMSSKRFENENFRMEYVKDCAAFVFPPKNLDDEYCKKLASLFEMTDSHSYFYFKIYGINYISSSKAATRVYDNTVFAFLENQLKKEKTIPCKDII